MTSKPISQSGRHARTARTLFARARLAHEESRQLIARARLLIPACVCSQCGYPIERCRTRSPLAGVCSECGRVIAG